MSERLTDKRIAHGGFIEYKNYDKFAKLPNEREIYDRLCDLEGKIEQGKLVELPFQIGDEKFAILPNTDVIVKGKVCTIIYQNEFLIDFAYKSEEYDYTAYAQLLPEELFDTYEEAEAKWKERKNDTEILR
ncbi:MAG: hypothetical protein J6J71_04835 [Prevotella sp.]|nr:hypothetical protein [Prevotella sp.]